MSLPYLEIEAKLVISSDSPREIALAIGRLDSLGPWSLRQRPPLSARDRYFDLHDDALGRLGMALRLRWTADSCLITVKGPESEATGILERRELERPWTRDALQSVLAYVASRGLQLAIPDNVFSDDDPEVVLEALGLGVVQDRTTDRVRREVVSPDDESVALAELAVDEVEYRVAPRGLKHYEVEIELESSADAATLGAISTELQRQWKELRQWPHSKLVTGRAIGELMRDPDCDKLIGVGGTLKPEFYGAIDELLRRRG